MVITTADRTMSKADLVLAQDGDFGLFAAICRRAGHEVGEKGEVNGRDWYGCLLHVWGEKEAGKAGKGATWATSLFHTLPTPRANVAR